VIDRLPPATRRPLYIAVKAVHSVAFFVLQSAILYLLYKGIRGESDRKAGAAAALVGGECAVYAGNGFRCPLTGLAEDLGAKSGQVTDIFLPKWLADNIANIYFPLFVLALFLHVRNLRRRRGSESSPTLVGRRTPLAQRLAGRCAPDRRTR
jgi:hypothetical protein